MKNFNVSVILQVESDGMICASVNPMSLFIILLSLTISSTCYENDLTSRTEVVRVSSEKAFPFIMENKSFCFRCSYSSNASLFIFVADFLNSSIQ